MSSSEYNITYYQENTDRERKRSLNWYYANKDKIDKEKKKEYNKKYRLANLEKWAKTPEQRKRINERKRFRYASDAEYREKQIQKSKNYFHKNPLVKKRQRLNGYNITMEQYDKMLDSQEHKCVICGYSDKTDKNFFPVIDHNHENGRVRGLLCMNCNMGLGKFKDDVNLLRSAISYLEMN